MIPKDYNPLEFVTGFMMGAVAGILLNFLLLFIYNLLARGLGWPRIDPAWWMGIPIPILLGIGMGRAIASLHLEDY